MWLHLVLGFIVVLQRVCVVRSKRPQSDVLLIYLFLVHVVVCEVLLNEFVHQILILLGTILNELIVVTDWYYQFIEIGVYFVRLWRLIEVYV